MNNELKKAVRNIIYLIMLDLVALPAAIFLYLTHGFHVVHVVLGIAYLHGLLVVYDTSKILLRQVQALRSQDETFFEEEEEEYIDESLKPEMKKAMDEVFGLQKH